MAPEAQQTLCLPACLPACLPVSCCPDGGYVAAHTYLLNRRGPPQYTLSSLVDHAPSHCRMCKHEALVRFHRDRALAEAQASSSDNKQGWVGGDGRPIDMHWLLLLPPLLIWLLLLLVVVV